MKKISLAVSLLSLPFLTAGCLHVETHSSIDPIHMTLDVNLKVQLQKELANAFGEIDAASKTVEHTGNGSSSN